MKRTTTLLLLLLFSLSFFGQNGVFRPANIPLQVPVTAGQIQEAIRQAFPALYALPTDLALAYTKKSPGGSHWTFSQTYNNLPIYATQIKAKVNPLGRITSFMDNLQLRILAPKDDRFQLSASSVLFGLHKQLPRFDMEIERMYEVVGGYLVPIYRVKAYAQDGPASYEIRMHAISGEELGRESLTVYYGHTHYTDGDTSGRGRVFNPNPCTAAGAAYGTLFSDNNDMHAPIFDQYTDTVILQDISFNGQVFSLDGPYVKILEFSAPQINPVTSTSPDFFYYRDQSGFEDVMCYYHIDTFQRYVQSLGYSIYDHKPILIDAHGGGGADQSAFSDNGRIYYGIGNVDDGEDADVIIHEYGHALAFDASPGTRGGQERNGLEEGYGDYFAAAYSYDLRADYGWATVMNWDGHSLFWPGRSAATTMKYQSSGLGLYEIGEIWASTMMQIRQEIGSREADQLQLEVLFGCARLMTVRDAYDLLIQADSALFGGSHEQTIRYYFCQREVLTGSECLGVSIDPGIKERPVSWSVYPNPSEGLVGINWLEYTPPCPDVVVTVVNNIGQKIATLPFEGKTTVTTDINLAPGIYMLTLYIEGKRNSSKKLLVR